MAELAGRSIIITGSARGIGRATVEACVRDGAHVGLNYLDSEAEANELMARYPSSIDLLPFDVTDHSAACRMVREFAERRGSA